MHAYLLSHFSYVQLFLTLWTIACQGSTVHGILQSRILEWVAMSSSRGSPRPRDWTCISCTTGGFFTVELLGKPVTMAIIKESTNNKCWRSCGVKGALFHCWWECKLIHPLWRTVWRFIKKNRNKTTIWPNSLSTGHIPWGNHNWKGHMYPNVHRRTIYNN